MGVNEETVNFLVCQKKLEDDYKDLNVLPKISFVKAPLAYVIKKTITVQTYGDYPTYEIPDDEMIDRILHLPLDKNKLLLEGSAERVQDHTAEYVIDKRMVYIILDQI